MMKGQHERMKELTPTSSTEKRSSRRHFLATSAAALGTSLVPAFAGSRRQTPNITTTDLNGLTLFQGAGSNVVAMPGPDGALMIDGGLASNADVLLNAVREATGNDRVQTLINTHWHPEQTGANVAVGRDGGTIIAHEKTAMYLGNTVTSLTFEGRLAPLPEEGRPNRTVRVDDTIEFAGQTVYYEYLPAAHTDGDLYVHFPELNVLVAGGVVSGEEWPAIDHRNGAWYGGRVRALERLVEQVDADTVVVPAHGRLITGSDIRRVNEIYQELFETMIGYLNMGYGPEDAAEANPLAQYEDEFGDATDFLYAALRSMLIAYVPD
jgi:glyoxylase-like metal-dependent hydrolase (beta-lactamase superfamily II)